jgi:hypothetical protein
MKKIINWKLYNTDTAECIGWYFKDWIKSEDLYNYIDTNIYLTDNKQFLLYIEEWLIFDTNIFYWNISFKYEDLELLNNEEMIKWLKENNPVLWEKIINNNYSMNSY